jgi:hypothetical protein
MALKTTSRINRTKIEKMKSLVARLALMTAAKDNPNMYKKYLTQRQRYLQVKLLAIKRYTPHAIIQARKLLNAPTSSVNK